MSSRLLMLCLLIASAQATCASREASDGVAQKAVEPAGSAAVGSDAKVAEPTPTPKPLPQDPPPPVDNTGGKTGDTQPVATPDKDPKVPPSDRPKDPEASGSSSRAVAEDEIYRRVEKAKAEEIRPDDMGQGGMRIQTNEGKVLALPLAHTAVDAQVSGFLGQVWVTQYFVNPLDHPIEAVYVFPLPSNAAVDDMEMVIGTKVIRGVMKKREEARQIYEDARKQGKTASLLEQERPNIFTQSVANIMPGDKIKVRIRYVQDLKYENGTYEFVFPMVVGPRYIPGQPTGQQAGGWSPDTNQVPDASRITPPVLKPGDRSGQDIEVTLLLAPGVEISDLKSPSHDIVVDKAEDGRHRVKLAAHDTIPNKDLTVRYKAAGDSIQVASLFHNSELGAYFMLLFVPEAAPKDEDVVPREMVFVFDVSGSMSGAPLAKCKEAAKMAMKSMRAGDSFNIFEFSNSARGFASAPVPNTPENLRDGLRFVDQLNSGGGTEMIQGIRAALDYPKDPRRMRIVMFMTDGYIGNDDEIMQAVRDKVGDSRLFSFGIGSSVNRYLLDGLAEAGRGAVTYVRQDESPEEAVKRFYSRIDSPVLVDIKVETQGDVKVSEIFPSPVPDLFLGQPLVVHGKFEGKGPATIVITGRRGSSDFRKELKVNFPAVEAGNAVLATLWARSRVTYLMTKMGVRQDQDIIAEVTNIAIKYRIMSQYTSFVAVEEQVRNVDGRSEKIQVPVEMPEGVSHEGVFGVAQPTAPMAVSPSRGYSGLGSVGGGAGVGDTSKGYRSRTLEDKKAEEAGTELENTPVATSATSSLTSVVVLDGPVSESDVRSWFSKGSAVLSSELMVVMKNAAVAPGSYTVMLTLSVASDGSVSVVGVNTGNAAVDAKAAKAAVEKWLNGRPLPAQTRASRIKLNVTVTLK